MKFKGILLDLDNTLYDYDTAHKAAITAVYDLLEKKFAIKKSDSERYFKTARGIVATDLKNTAASHNRMLYFQKMIELLNLNVSRYTLSLYNKYWNTFLKNMHFYPGAIEFLKHIKKQKTCIITDLTAHIQHKKIKKLGIQKYIDFLVTSEEAGVEKPDPSIFMIALKKLNLKPCDVCMIGDNFTKDICGASQLKIKSFWFHPGAQLKNFTKNGDITVISHFESFKEMW